MSGKRLRWVAAEADIDTAAKTYEAKGLLSLSKVAPPTLTARRGVVIHLANPFLDYIGAWTERGGRLLVVEVKSTKEERLPLDRSPGVSESQVVNFHRWNRSGAAGGVVWFANGRPRWVGVGDLFAAIGAGRKSLKAEECRPITQGVGVIYDFLPRLREDYPEDV